MAEGTDSPAAKKLRLCLSIIRLSGCGKVGFHRREHSMTPTVALTATATTGTSTKFGACASSSMCTVVHAIWPRSDCSAADVL